MIAKWQPLPPNSFPTLRSLRGVGIGVRSSTSDRPLNILTVNIPWRQLTGLDLQLEPRNLLQAATLDEASMKPWTYFPKPLTSGVVHYSWNAPGDDRRDTQRDKLSLSTLDTFKLQLILLDAKHSR